MAVSKVSYLQVTELFRIRICAKLLATKKPTAGYLYHEKLSFENGKVFVCGETVIKQFSSLTYQTSGCSETIKTCKKNITSTTNRRAKQIIDLTAFKW